MSIAITGAVKERGEKNGAVFVVLQKDVPDAEGRTAKVWAGRDYKGLVPNQGERGTATCFTEQVGEYQVKKFETWEPDASAPLNGTVFTGRQPGVNDNWVAARGCLFAAIDALGAGKAIGEYESFARSLLGASLDLAGYAQELQREPKKSEDF